jgi:hypothetical protein
VCWTYHSLAPISALMEAKISLILLEKPLAPHSPPGKSGSSSELDDLQGVLQPSLSSQAVRQVEAEPHRAD